jgi:hypothetical protein
MTENYTLTIQRVYPSVAGEQGPFPIVMSLVSPDGIIIGQYHGLNSNSMTPTTPGLDYDRDGDPNNGQNAFYPFEHPGRAASIVRVSTAGLESYAGTMQGFVLRFITPDYIPGTWGIRASNSYHEDSPYGAIALHADLAGDGTIGCFGLSAEDWERFMNDYNALVAAGVAPLGATLVPAGQMVGRFPEVQTISDMPQGVAIAYLGDVGHDEELGVPVNNNQSAEISYGIDVGSR